MNVEIEEVKFDKHGDKDVTVEYVAKADDRAHVARGKAVISKDKYDENSDVDSLIKIVLASLLDWVNEKMKVNVEVVTFHYEDNEPKSVTITYNTDGSDNRDHRLHGRPEVSKEEYDGNGDTESLRKLVKDDVVKWVEGMQDDANKDDEGEDKGKDNKDDDEDDD